MCSSGKIGDNKCISSFPTKSKIIKEPYKIKDLVGNKNYEINYKVGF